MAQESKPRALRYALTTVPSPLTASPPHAEPGNEDELAYGSVDIVISNSGSSTVRCQRITIALPVGPLAQDLALTGGGIAPYVEPASGWKIAGSQPDPSTVRFSVEPSGEVGKVTADGLRVTLKNIAVSNKTGVSYIEIEEWATTGEEIPETPNTGTLEVAKFPFRSGTNRP
ncbi:hypothetical protein ACFXOD_36640 [Streptomyces sp. NPDC059161]|uniref:hypothetical protein n=1 Tax=Streptomyces sp. NPDC059161 TaxID=3346749 RepID=UPI0036A3F9D4